MSYTPKRIFASAIACFCFAFNMGAEAANRAHDYTSLCDQAASSATQVENVPTIVLKAIARTESGKSFDGELKPWPWAINIEGKGVWLSTAAEAIALAKEHSTSGAHNFDVGCFQLNYKWHGSHFSSLEQMFDPYENAIYAAKFLKELHAELGNWSDAVGAYHSRNQQFAQPYLARFHTILNALKTTAPEGHKAGLRNNTFPLLQGTARSQTRGSLFPETKHRPRHLFAPNEVRG